MNDKKTSITLKGLTKSKLDVLGHKGMSYDDIVNAIIHQRNILMIHSLCKGQKFEDYKQLENVCNDVFDKIEFVLAPPFQDKNGEWIEWSSFDHCLQWAMEMALDEDLIGSNDREISLGEAVTNVYCLMNDISAPTWGIGAMKNPFAP